MAPTGRRARRTLRKTIKPRRSHYRRKLAKPTIQKTSVLLEDLVSNSSTISSDNLSKMEGFNIQGVDDHISTTTINPCSTPKAPRFRIPEVDTCPLAPKKQRVLSNCSLQRTPIAFFAPPDLELFFFFAHRDISV
ncbi:CCAAT-binding transcription factor family protein [Hibiscus syriacus]|uniref:CCAAT-binding transcription factor family protein n=1 Tax=Hibiscus syriacus TaxID=106335 RepID=A0A6A3CL98_HIBSY|nr:cyclin-dependent protein kinase inhibitor SMR9-like [Hibiscus syriacus]KAE8728372.1 CCAAT-binding transcription factor family protein [Hibiscus syriacus]